MSNIDYSEAIRRYKEDIAELEKKANKYLNEISRCAYMIALLNREMRKEEV